MGRRRRRAATTRPHLLAGHPLVPPLVDQILRSRGGELKRCTLKSQRAARRASLCTHLQHELVARVQGRIPRQSVNAFEVHGHQVLHCNGSKQQACVSDACATGRTQERRSAPQMRHSTLVGTVPVILPSSSYCLLPRAELSKRLPTVCKSKHAACQHSTCMREPRVRAPSSAHRHELAHALHILGPWVLNLQKWRSAHLAATCWCRQPPSADAPRLSDLGALRRPCVPPRAAA